MSAQPNLAAVPAQAPAEAQAPAVDIAQLTKRTLRESKITLAPRAPRAPFGEGTFITSGTRPVAGASEDVLVIVDGTTRTATSQAAILLAIVHGVIPRAVVEACLAAHV
jgi:hypothetical protein